MTIGALTEAELSEVDAFRDQVMRCDEHALLELHAYAVNMLPRLVITIRARDAEIERLEEAYTTKDAELASAEATLDARDAEVAELVARVVELEEEIERLRSAATKLRSAVDMAIIEHGRDCIWLALTPDDMANVRRALKLFEVT